MTRLMLVLIGICLFAGLSVSATQAQVYGAIAYDRSTDRVGWSTGYSSKREAGTRALQECAKDNSAHCELMVVFAGYKCGTYAIGARDDAYGAGPSRAEAERNAVAECNKKGDKCRARVTACNAPPGKGRFDGLFDGPHKPPRSSEEYGKRYQECLADPRAARIGPGTKVDLCSRKAAGEKMPWEFPDTGPGGPLVPGGEGWADRDARERRERYNNCVNNPQLPPFGDCRP
jgi:hypothetical protein